MELVRSREHVEPEQMLEVIRHLNCQILTYQLLFFLNKEKTNRFWPGYDKCLNLPNISTYPA